MASKVQFSRQEINWVALIPKLLVLGILCWCAYQFNKKDFFLIGLLSFLILTKIARWIFFPKVLHAGLKLIREAKFQEAIPFVQDSIDYYTKHSWIDKYRFVLLISSSKKTIREVSICNLAYCYLQTGNVQRAKEIYNDVLKQYPENITAINALNTINIISQDKAID